MRALDHVGAALVSFEGVQHIFLAGFDIHVHREFQEVLQVLADVGGRRRLEAGMIHVVLLGESGFQFHKQEIEVEVY